jgi:hypothetical protein
MNSIKENSQLLSQFASFVTMPLQIKAYQIKQGDTVEYVTGSIAELTTQHGKIEFSHTRPIALGDYLITAMVNGVCYALHMDKQTFVGIYAPQAEHVPTAINESAAKELIEQANVLERLPALNHTTRKAKTKVANTLKSVAFLLRNGEKPI